MYMCVPLRGYVEIILKTGKSCMQVSVERLHNSASLKWTKVRTHTQFNSSLLKYYHASGKTNTKQCYFQIITSYLSLCLLKYRILFKYLISN